MHVFISLVVVAVVSFVFGVFLSPKIRTDIKYIESKAKDKALNTINRL